MLSKDMSRVDLLVVLASMGVVLPKETKLPLEELGKRLGSALDASQEMAALLGSPPVNLDLLFKWASNPGKTLFKASQRGNFTELTTGEMEQPKKGPGALKSDTFKELRQSVLALSYSFDHNIRQTSFVCQQIKSAIALRILEVYRVKDEVPLFFLEFKDLVSSAKEDLENLTNAFFPSGDLNTIEVSHLEYCAILKLFKRNSTKLADKHRSDTGGLGKKKGSTKTFVLPLCPLSMQVLGKLTSDVGCEICGEKIASKCSQCLTVSYCGKECQRLDWPNHKATCKSLKGGSWHPIDLFDMPELPPGVGDQAKHRFVMNRLDPFTSSSGLHSTTGDDAPDSHRGKIFLAKFQAPLMGGVNPSMMIYDRQRSFQSFWRKNSNLETFNQAMRVMGGRPKFYKWVRWVGENKMEICLDRSPASDPVW
ncbi:hypothetical protein CPB83DRAFT_853592 [Crepidotus variabilis]|uniref:MYND-type domain-containing protein n=1 Tax=Crepidotus variabilis TaxID=179855 RepID=A0A9P6EH78_9AGAR|nr:hypothetical protein CPB83DRAFT_853592 [Crepidotus variabilis]